MGVRILLWLAKPLHLAILRGPLRLCGARPDLGPKGFRRLEVGDFLHLDLHPACQLRRNDGEQLLEGLPVVCANRDSHAFFALLVDANYAIPPTRDVLMTASVTPSPRRVIAQQAPFHPPTLPQGVEVPGVLHLR